MDTTRVKTGMEIGILAGQLTSINQAFVLNTINALLFCQQTNNESIDKPPKNKPA